MTTDSAQITTNLPAHGDVTTTVGPVVGGGELLSVGASMFVVVAIIVLLGWLYSRSRFLSGGATELINVVASRSLGPKERLLIVEVANQQLLVGMTSTAVQTLHVFDEAVSIETAKPAGNGFTSKLRSALAEMHK